MTSNARTTWPEHTNRLVVGDLRIDLPNRRVERPDGVRQELPQRVFDLLLVFLAEPDTVQSRENLFERVWQGVIVEDANLTQGVWMLRKAFGEERRHWFRTVSKTGYVFEPPGPVRAEDSEACSAMHWPVSTSAEGAGAPTPLGPPIAAHEATTGIGTTGAWWASMARIAATAGVILVVIVALALPVLSPHGRSGTQDGAHVTAAAPARKVAAPLRVHLVAEPPVLEARTPEGLWAAMLAEAWLSYKLELLPETIPMPPGLPAGTRLAPDERRIAIRASRDPEMPGRIQLQARIIHASGRASAVLDVRGPESDAVRLADVLSQKVLARLLPAHEHTTWPALPRDARTARQYAVAVQHARRREWQSAEREGESVAKAAPEFGPVRWLLAQLSAHRGDVRGAIDRATEARRMSTPLPEDAERVFEALSLAVEPARREHAINSLMTLEKAWPERIDFAVLRASHLVRAGRPTDALAAAFHPPAKLRTFPVEVRIRQAITSSEANSLNGDPVASRRHAQAALALATGPGLARERGAAQMMLARTHHATSGTRAAPELFELAAESFDAGGDTSAALYARFVADNIRLNNSPKVSAHLRPLIESARRLHNVSLEVQALRATAYRFYRAGDHARFREYLRNAQDSANRSNDLHSQRTLDLDLMNEDFFMANITSARARIRRLRAGGLDGRIGYLVPLHDGAMTMHEGRYREALKILGDDHASNSPKPPLVVEANYACVRADILLAMMNTVAARPQIDRCRNPSNPSLQVAARMLDAQADLADGQRESARIKLRGIEKELSSLGKGIERWPLDNGIGYAFATLGDYDRAERLLHGELDAVRNAGYLLMLAGVEATLAEIAAARGDWPRSRALVLSARRHLPQEAWVFNQRLDRLDIIDSLIHGDKPAARARMTSLGKRAEVLGDHAVLRDLQVLSNVIVSGDRRTASSEDTELLDPSQAYIDWIYGRLPDQRPTSASRF